jgi:DNA-binding NtrC family response regulator
MSGGETVHLLEEQRDQSVFHGLIGGSDAMLAVFDQIVRAAQTDVTVLITGESGTGKESVAEALHNRSSRRGGPYIAVNMAAIPETLVESELFGHVKGAFTGAGGNRTGRLEAADGGTIFIDEIGDLELTSQAKLLRVLEDRQITPIGTNQRKRVDVRVIAATSRQLEKMVAEGRFREDLYYRLNVVAISLPALRARRGDIRLLVDAFLKEICRANDRPLSAPDADLWCFLESYDWPGNVRQLRNCVESMVVLTGSTTLTVRDLPLMIHNDRPARDFPFEIPEGLTLEQVERAAIRQTLGRCGGNRTQAAQSLGISVRTLQRKLKRWQREGDGSADRRIASQTGSRSEDVVGQAPRAV